MVRKTYLIVYENQCLVLSRKYIVCVAVFVGNIITIIRKRQIKIHLVFVASSTEVTFDICKSDVSLIDDILNNLKLKVFKSIMVLAWRWSLYTFLSLH